MSDIHSLSNAIQSFRADLSLDFFNNRVNEASNSNEENVQVQGEVVQSAPAEWNPQLESILDRVLQESGAVRMSAISHLFSQNGIQLPNETRTVLENLQLKMALSMEALSKLKKSAILVDQLSQRLDSGFVSESSKIVGDAIRMQSALAAKLRELGETYPQIQPSLESQAAKCERCMAEIRGTISAINPSPRAGEVLAEMSRVPEELQNLERSLNNSNVDNGLKVSLLDKYNKAVQAWRALGSPLNALVFSRELLSEQRLVKGEFECICDTLGELAEALHALHGDGQIGDSLEEMADAVDRNIAHVATLCDELPDLLGVSSERTFQELRNEAFRDQWMPRLGSIMRQVVKEQYGIVTMEDINRALTCPIQPNVNAGVAQPQAPQLYDISIEDRSEIERLQHDVEVSMGALHALKGVDIRNAFKLEGENIDSREKQIRDAVKKAISSQGDLADKLHDVGKAVPEIQNRFETLADRCDNRAVEILSTVHELNNPPRAEEILREMGRGPETLKDLATELDNCRISSRLKKDVLQKYNAALDALKNLGAQNALVVSDEVQHDVVYGNNRAYFNEAYEALDELSQALHGLRMEKGASNALEDMADAVDVHMRHIVEMGYELASLLEENSDENVKDIMVSMVPQMHGTQDVLTCFSSELEPLVRMIDDFIAAPDSIHDNNELLMISQKMSQFKQNMSNLLSEGQLKLHDGSHLVVDTSVLEPLQALMDRTQAYVDKFRVFFETDAKKRQIQQEIGRIFSVSVPEKLLKSDFWKTQFPELNQLAEMSSKCRQLATEAQRNPQQAIAGLEELSAKLNEIRNNGNWVQLYTQQIRKLENLQDAINQALSNQPITDREIKDLVDKLRQNADTERGTADIIAAMALDGFGEFRDGLVAERKEVVEYKFEYVRNMFKNLTEQNALCDEYMKGAKLLKMLKEDIPLSTIIETRLHGAPTDYIDELCDDVNLVEEPKELGSGAANTVLLCSYKDKNGGIVQKVFKSEFEGSLGNLNLLLGAAGAPNLQNAYLNIASKKVAEVLHCGDIMPKTSVGMVHGKYGVFMDFVKGSAVSEVSRNYDAMMLTLSSENKISTRGQLMKKYNQLQFVDLLVAQGDRHNGNYKLNLDKSDVDGNVSVKVGLTGFDNDACMSEWRTGLTKLNLNKMHLDYLKGYANMNYNGGVNGLLANVEANGGLVREQDGSITVDMTKMDAAQLDILHYATGMQTFKVPDYMDIDLYNGLMELDANPAKFDACLPLDLLPAAMNAAKTRLRDMIALAKTYYNQGRIVDDAKWQSLDFQKQLEAENESMLNPASAGSHRQKSNYLSDLYFRDLAWWIK